MNASTRLSNTLASCLIAVTALAAAPVQAQALRPASETGCRGVAHPDSLAELELKAYYLSCSDAAVEGRLDWSEIALCSIAYERLLRQTFEGDFLALLAWSRSQDGRERRDARCEGSAHHNDLRPARLSRLRDDDHGGMATFAVV